MKKTQTIQMALNVCGSVKRGIHAKSLAQSGPHVSGRTFARRAKQVGRTVRQRVFAGGGLVRILFASGLADAPTSLSVLAEVVWWLAWWCETAGFGTVRCRASVNVPFINGN